MIFQHCGEIVGGQPQLGCEDIHGADGQEPERNVAAGNSVHDFVDRAVAAGGHDSSITFQGGMARQDFGVARVRGSAEGSPANDLLHLRAQTLGSGAARRRIQDNEGVFHGENKVSGLFFKLRRRNLPA